MSTPMPFVNFKPYRTQNINSTPTLIFGSQDTCLVDGLLITNLVNQSILASVYVLTETAPNVTVETLIANELPIGPNQSIELLPDSILTVASGELLYAFSDYSTNIFNVNISYRELTELGGVQYGRKDAKR